MNSQLKEVVNEFLAVCYGQYYFERLQQLLTAQLVLHLYLKVNFGHLVADHGQNVHRHCQYRQIAGVESEGVLN